MSIFEGVHSNQQILLTSPCYHLPLRQDQVMGRSIQCWKINQAFITQNKEHRNYAISGFCNWYIVIWTNIERCKFAILYID